MGNLKGVGRVYQQTLVDTYAKVGFAKLYDRKTPITAADLLNDPVSLAVNDPAFPGLLREPAEARDAAQRSRPRGIGGIREIELPFLVCVQAAAQPRELR
jgi:hypothetical protein